MSGSLLRGPRRHLLTALCAAAGLALASPATARADELDDFKAKESIKAQKAIREVKGLIAEARKQESKNPLRARSLLRQARLSLDESSVTEKDRGILSRQITQALKSVEAAIRERDSDADSAAEREALRKREEARRRDLEAQKKSPRYAQAKSMIETGRGALGFYDRMKAKREAGFLALDREVLESASRMTEERFTERFREITERRKPKLSNAEKHLLKMLNSTLSVNFDAMPLKEVIEFLSDRAKINIFVDETSLKDADIDYDDPVTFKAKKFTVRSILKRILAEKGLTFIIKEAAVQVMTPEKASKFMVVRAYPIGDLLPVPPAGVPPMFNRMAMIQGANEIIALIVSTVEPASWAINGEGGKGTIVFSPTTMSLIIRQSAEFHYQMGGFLSK
jgi:hypothetical protein